MIEIWEESARFQTTSQRLADQVRTMIKKAWFSDLGILEIYRKINIKSKQDKYQIKITKTDTTNIEKQEQSNRNEPQTNNNHNTTHPNYTEQKLT